MNDRYDLDVVGVLEGTDKSSSVDSAWDYLRHYQRLFRRFQHEPINFIEIGVAGGSSLKVWKAFFTQAQIIGVDVMPHCARFAEDRVLIEIGSQDDPGFLARLCATYPPSIIIDDGSHRADHVVYTFERMFPSLLPGGVYIAEDIALHFGEGAKNWKGVEERSPPEYFLGLARSCLARTVQGAADWGTARYNLEQVDSVEFIAGAAVLQKKGAARDVGAALAFADDYLRGRDVDAGVHERLCHFILRQSGPLDQAEAALRRAIDVAGETPGLLRVYADIRARQDRVPEAAAIAERAATMSQDAGMWIFVGHLRTRQGDHAAAARAYETAAALHPDNPMFAFEWSVALERGGDLPKALAAARQGLKLAVGGVHEERVRIRVDQLRARVGE